MSDSLPPSSPANSPQPDDLPAENVPEPQTSPEAVEVPDVPDDPEAIAADRAGFKFLAIGFAIFFVLIAVCASIVALVMKSMGI